MLCNPYSEKCWALQFQEWKMCCYSDSWVSILAGGQGDPFAWSIFMSAWILQCCRIFGHHLNFFLVFPFRLFIPQSLVSLSCFPVVPIALSLVPWTSHSAFFFCTVFFYTTWNSSLVKANPVSSLISEKILNQPVWVITRVHFVVYMLLGTTCGAFLVLFFCFVFFKLHSSLGSDKLFCCCYV